MTTTLMYGYLCYVKRWKLALVFMAYLAAPLLVAEAVAGGERQPGRVLGAPLWVKSAACAYLLGMLLVFHSRQNVGFIYFQF